MQNLERVKDRIRHLLTTAANTAATPGEVENALRFAKEIMNAHHLEEQDLAVEPQDQHADVRNAERSRDFCMVEKKICAWEQFLANFVKSFVGGIGCYVSGEVFTFTRRGLVVIDAQGKKIEGKRVYFYGITEDVQIACDLYRELRAVIISMAGIRYGGSSRGNGGTYAEGFVAGLNTQLKVQAEQEKIGSTSRGLILVDRRNELIEFKARTAREWFDAEFGVKLQPAKKALGCSGSSEAWVAGKHDGAATSVGSTRRGKLT